MRSIGSIMLLCLLLMTCSTASAAFNRTAGLPTILIGEVRGYGENELIPKYFEDFRDELAAALQQSNKVNVDVSRIMLNADQPSEEDKLFSLIHKDAIARGALYRREYANAEMIRYADVLLGGGDPKKGRSYFQDDNITKERMKRAGKPYELTFTAVKQVNEIGQRYGVDYILFVNLRDADVWRKTGGIFGTHPDDDDFRGKKVLVELEYYLVNAKTGMVYEGQNAEKKTSLTTNALVGKYGNDFTVHDMVNYILKDQAEKVADGVINKALKAVGGK
ncbi:MAG: hypothetical protein IJ668_01710 [Selenomonadaceae bacterium]|nr:hypothetical protein [Selenomonadaceae bacterium]